MDGGRGLDPEMTFPTASTLNDSVQKPMQTSSQPAANQPASQPTSQADRKHARARINDM